MPEDPAKRFAGGPEAKLFDIGHKPFKGINTQVPRDSIDDEEFSWLENMQPIGKSLYSLNDSGMALYSGGSSSNPINYFYMYSSSYNPSITTPAQFVFVAFQSGNGKIVSATSGAVLASSTAGMVFGPGNPFYGSPLPQAVQFNNGGIGIIRTGVTNGLFAADQTNFYGPGDSSPAWWDNSSSSHMATAVSGVCLGVWQERLWYARGNLYGSSVPDDAADWTINDGATQQSSQDPFIKQQFLSLQQANGFLYIFGDSSVNVISNIQTTGSPTVVTTFNNQNVDPQVGASWQNTVQPFGRGLVYANTTGVYALFGGAAQKISDQLDGIFNQQGGFANKTLVQGPSSAVAMINNQRCYMLLVPLEGPFDTVSRNALVVWDGKKWFIASQTPALTFIGTQMINSMPSAWGTDGISLYKLFAGTGSSGVSKIWQTKLFNGSGLQITKGAYRIFSRFEDIAGTGVTETATIDSQLINQPLNQQSFSQTDVVMPVIWLNGSSQVVQFQNTVPANVNWTPAGPFDYISGTGITINTRGNVIGWTAQSTSKQFVLSEEMMVYQEQSPIGG